MTSERRLPRKREVLRYWDKTRAVAGNVFRGVRGAVADSIGVNTVARDYWLNKRDGKKDHVTTPTHAPLRVIVPATYQSASGPTRILESKRIASRRLPQAIDAGTNLGLLLGMGFLTGIDAPAGTIFMIEAATLFGRNLLVNGGYRLAYWHQSRSSRNR